MHHRHVIKILIIKTLNLHTTVSDFMYALILSYKKQTYQNKYVIYALLQRR